MLILIDNYDSFTYNIVQMLGTAPPGAPADWQPPELSVFRNDAVTVAALMALSPTRLIVSPGPCTPSEAGISVRAILAASSREPPIPVLGVCLGHQAIGQAFGGRVLRAPRPMHGKTSPVTHDGKGVFAGLIMGLRHKRLPVEGIQFHPESIMTN